MRIASIDLGTNTCLLLILKIYKSGKYNILADEISYPRIGKNVDKFNLINFDSFIKVEKIFNKYKKIAKINNVDKIIATGTSALRDAKNGNEFVKYIFNKTNIKIEIISGDEEANRTYLGVTYKSKINKNAIIDIGGGSTEIIIGNGNKINFIKSFNIGSVRLTEKFLKHTPPLENEIIDFKKYCFYKFHKFNEQLVSKYQITGVAGTATTLIAIKNKLNKFDKDKIENKIITKKQVENIFNKLSKLNKKELSKISQISDGRKDIIVAGTLILLCFFEYFKINKIKVSTKGLRFGSVLKYFI